jgi:hypothetical protein
MSRIIDDVEAFLELELRRQRDALEPGPGERNLYRRALADFRSYAEKRGWPFNPHGLAAYILESRMSRPARQVLVAAYFREDVLALAPIYAALSYASKRSSSAQPRVKAD